MASREKAKGQHAPKSGRLPRRWVACFVLAILQTIIGLGLLAVGAADVVFTLDHNCKDRTGASFLQGVVCVVSGAFALAAYSPRRVRAQGHPNRVLVAVHVLLSFLVAVVSFNVVTCLAAYTGDRTAALFAVILSKVVLTYTCHVLGGVCAGVAVPDLCRNGAGLVTFDAFHRDVTAKQVALRDAFKLKSPFKMMPDELEEEIGSWNTVPWSDSNYAHLKAAVLPWWHEIHAPQNQSTAPTTAAAAPSSVAGPVQLPEARSHVQEAPGTGEKLTVVTLPEADVIYAVPENSYVVRRPEGSYVAPPGNTRLAPFFPTYTRVAIE